MKNNQQSMSKKLQMGQQKSGNSQQPIQNSSQQNSGKVNKQVNIINVQSAQGRIQGRSAIPQTANGVSNSNIQAGLKLKTLRVSGSNQPIYSQESFNQSQKFTHKNSQNAQREDNFEITKDVSIQSLNQILIQQQIQKSINNCEKMINDKSQNQNQTILDKGKQQTFQNQFDLKSQQNEEIKYLETPCFFKDIEEQSVNINNTFYDIFDGKQPNQNGFINQLSMRCIYQQGSTSVKIITTGGQEFVVPMELPVHKIWTIEDGVLIQAIFNNQTSFINELPNQIHSAYDNQKQIINQFCYFTLIKHPLNELYPLYITSNQQNSQIQTSENLIFTSHIFPILVFFNQFQKQIKIGFLKNINKQDLSKEQSLNVFALSLMTSQRHPILQLSPQTPELIFEEFYNYNLEYKPDLINLTSDRIRKQCILQIYSKQNRNLIQIYFDPKSFEFQQPQNIKELCNVILINEDQAYEQKPVKISKGYHQKRESGIFKFIISRIKILSQNYLLFVFDESQDLIQVLKEGMNLYQIQIGNPIKELKQYLSDEIKKSGYLQVVTNNQSNQIVKIDTSQVLHQNYLVASILKIMRRSLPYECFIKIYLNFIQLCSSNNQSSFQNLNILLFSLLKCEMHKTQQGFYNLKMYFFDENQKKSYDQNLNSNGNVVQQNSDNIKLHASNFANQKNNQNQFNEVQNQQENYFSKLLNSNYKKNKWLKIFEKQQQQTDQTIENDKFILCQYDPRKIFSPYKESLFVLLHHFYEDLNTFSGTPKNQQHSVDLSNLLLKWVILSEGQNISQSPKIEYIKHYLKTQNQDIEQSEYQHLIQLSKQFTSSENIQFQKVASVVEAVKMISSGIKSDQKFQIFFENSRKLIRLAQIYNLSKNNNTSTIQNIIYPVLNNSPYQKQQNSQFLQNMYFPFYEQFQKIVLNQQQSNLISFDQNMQDYYLLLNKFRNLKPQERLILGIIEEQISFFQIKDIFSILIGTKDNSLFLDKYFNENQSIIEFLKQNYDINTLDFFKEKISSIIGNLKQREIQFNQKPQKCALQTNQPLQNINDEKNKQQNENKDDRSDKYNDHFKILQFLINQFKFSQFSSFKEVTHMLDSSVIIALKIQKIIGFQTLSEEDLKKKKQNLIEKLHVRQLSKMIGRGMLQIGTKDVINTERIQFPKICQQGFVPQADEGHQAIIQPEIKEELLKELQQWPLFHNGAASGFQIAQSILRQREKQINFARNWIMQHKPATPNSEHAGFILAMGLSGMLDTLQRTDVYQHLKTLHDSTVISILLGKSASQIGSMDQQFSKTLCVHISFLQPPSISADISLPVQSSAMIGASLLYLGSQNRQITEMLLSQIGRKPINDRSVEREVYALSAGMALGLVNLGAGSEKLNLQFGDLNIDERLIRFVEGGKQMQIPKSMLQASQHADSQQCSSIREGDQINIHITAPGGLFALTLIHLQSNNQIIASRLEMPETFNQLEYVRPSLLLQKVLCKNLILWDQIQPSQEWVQKQIPSIIQFSYNNSIEITKKKYSQQIGNERLDFAQISLCYTYMLTGAYLSIGYKYAGSCDKQAFKLINNFILILKKQKLATIQNQDLLHQIYTNPSKNLIDKYTQENCLCVLGLAIALIMAGSGDAECFKTLRIIRKRLESEMHYGHNMAINMALGLLFLGSGAYNLSNFQEKQFNLGPFKKNQQSIAFLLCALYPVFPKDTSDNKYHLQALRHFWALSLQNPINLIKNIENHQLKKNDDLNSLENSNGANLIASQIQKEKSQNTDQTLFYCQNKNHIQILKYFQEHFQKYKNIKSYSLMEQQLPQKLYFNQVQEQKQLISGILNVQNLINETFMNTQEGELQINQINRIIDEIVFDYKNSQKLTSDEISYHICELIREFNFPKQISSKIVYIKSLNQF